MIVCLCRGVSEHVIHEALAAGVATLPELTDACRGADGDCGACQSMLAVKALNSGIETARSLGDNGTRELLESLLTVRKSTPTLEAQPTLIEQVGEGNYLAQQIKSDD